MTIFFTNNEGGGFAGEQVIQENFTVEAFFKEQFKERSPADFLIRVNRQEVPASYVLQDTDKVTMTPMKIDGAA